MQYPQPRRGSSRLPSALTGNRDPWANGLNSTNAAPVAPVSLGRLAFGNNLTQHPLYSAANLPPYNAPAK